MPQHRYRPEVLAELAGKGIHPKAGTDPRQVRELVNELYRFEIRDLKLRLKETEGLLGAQPLENYRRQVLQLKAKYQRLLGLPAEAWVVPHEGPKDG